MASNAQSDVDEDIVKNEERKELRNGHGVFSSPPSNYLNDGDVKEQEGCLVGTTIFIFTASHSAEHHSGESVDISYSSHRSLWLDPGFELTDRGSI